ncbi:hypothetical protein GCM10009808_20170 [Microbacterium sediminicola]|uniref:HTH marR-type domain-containing protein n=1 Tax=Microbacterium sediminicola TaxID=415210 RepID=A0ABP4UC24_9MICO
MTTQPGTDPVDQIAAALLRLRGRGGPRRSMPEGADRRGHGSHHGRDEHHRGMGPMGPGGPRGGARLAGPAKMRVLDVLASRPEPLTVSELGEAIGVDQPRASRLVQQGVEQGLLRREADPDDARRTRIALTDEGLALVQGFRDQRREAISTALTSFTDSERSDLARLLGKLADAWPSGRD